MYKIFSYNLCFNVETVEFGKKQTLNFISYFVRGFLFLLQAMRKILFSAHFACTLEFD